MEFTWLQNRYYNPSSNESADYLIAVFDGALHFWSVSGLESKQNVIISTLRTIPGVYPFHSECSIQVIRFSILDIQITIIRNFTGPYISLLADENPETKILRN